MTDFELTFEVDELPDDVLDAIDQEFDAVVSGHPGLTLITVLVPGVTALGAAKTAVKKLEHLPGVVVRRICEDLVNRRDIAERSNVSIQAVGQWIRGDRHKFNAFPQPFNFVGGGVWLWPEVNDWLRRTEKEFDESVAFPCRNDYYEINRWISHRRAQQLVHVGITWTSDNFEASIDRLTEESETSTTGWTVVRKRRIRMDDAS
jgi:hypothetical protein